MVTMVAALLVVSVVSGVLGAKMGFEVGKRRNKGVTVLRMSRRAKRDMKRIAKAPTMRAAVLTPPTAPAHHGVPKGEL